MKKLALVLWVAALWPMSGWAAFQAGAIAGSRDGAGTPFAGQLSVGLLNGDAKEHVFSNDVFPGERYQLSRLDWDLKSVVMGGGNLSVRLLDKLTLNGGWWLALTEGGGEMDDYDWLIPEASPEWSDYSLSEVDVTEGYILDLNVAWDLIEWNDLTARVMAGYKQDGWTWEDRGVYALYSESGFRDAYYDLNGENMINYEQEFRMPYLGASADWALGDFSVSAHLIWSPLVSATDWDEHVARDMHFTEEFEEGDMVGLGIEARYDFPQGSFRGLFLTAALDYQKIDLIVGDMEYYDGTTGEVGGGDDAAGIESEYMILSLGGGVRF